MSDWTHPICFTCWRELYPSKRPVQLTFEYRVQENCCRCGRPTKLGSYFRADPATLKFCPGHEERM